MATFSEGFVMADPAPLPETAVRIIADAKKHAPGFAEILFEPETSCFKIITYKKGLDTVMSMVLKFIKDNKRIPGAFVKDDVELNFADYDRLRYPDAFAVMPFRAINRDLAGMDHHISLAKIMMSRGWDLNEGSDQFLRQTGCTISSNLDGTTIYLGADTEEILKFAEETLHIIIKDTVKEEQEQEHAAHAAAIGLKPSIDTARSVPTQVAAGFYPKSEKGSLIDLGHDDAQETKMTDWAGSVQASNVAEPLPASQGVSTASQASENLDTVSQLAVKTSNLSVGRGNRKQKKKAGPKKTPDEQLKTALGNLLDGNDVSRVHWSSAGVSYAAVKQVVEADRGGAAKQQPQLMDVCTERQKAFNCNYDGLESLGQENKAPISDPVPAAVPDSKLIDLGGEDYEVFGHVTSGSGPAPDNLLD